MLYAQILQNKPTEATDEGMHRCEGLDKANELREKDGESRVYIFRDFENQEYNMGIGLEFLVITHCPFCGSNICGG